MKDVDIDKIICSKEGAHLHDSKSSLCELMKLIPDDIDYEKLKRKDVFKHSDCIENEADALEEDRNEIVIE